MNNFLKCFSSVLAPLCIRRVSLLFTLIIFLLISCERKDIDNIQEAVVLEEITEELIITEEEIIPEPEFFPGTYVFKFAPSDLQVFLNDEPIFPFSSSAGLHSYYLEYEGTMRFSADGYISQQIKNNMLPIKKNIVGIKLENQNSIVQLVNEYTTGKQPKSAYFSPDGRRLFIPLLGEHGIDVFIMTEKGSLAFEKTLTVPDSVESGFVEAMCDARRRELWVTNMMENKVHIYNLDTLDYKVSLNTGGVFPKVVTQSPNGSITAVSNWISMDISIFDSNTKELLRKIPTGGTPRGMAFSPDSTLLYTAIYDDALVAVIDLTQNKITKHYRLYPGAGAARHVIYRDDKLYVSDMLRGTVNILNASTGELLHSKYVGLNINTITLSPDGRYVIASSRGRNHPEDYTRPGPEFGAVYILNAEDLTFIERIWGRNQPTGLAVSPDGKNLVFTDFLDANLELYRLF